MPTLICNWSQENKCTWTDCVHYSAHNEASDCIEQCRTPDEESRKVKCVPFIGLDSELDTLHKRLVKMCDAYDEMSCDDTRFGDVCEERIDAVEALVEYLRKRK